MNRLFIFFRQYYSNLQSFFTKRYDIKEYILQIVISLFIGSVAGLGAMVFHTLIEWMRLAINPVHFERFLQVPTFFMAIVPVIGALLIIGITRLFPAQASERDVKSIIKSVILQKVPIPIFNTLFNLVASAVTLGTGAPLGPE